jgi:hypothetical protein
MGGIEEGDALVGGDLVAWIVVEVSGILASEGGVEGCGGEEATE